MTRDDVIRIARKNNLLRTGELERFAAEIAAIEREACAKVCEETRFPDSYTAMRYVKAIQTMESLKTV